MELMACPGDRERRGFSPAREGHMVRPPTPGPSIETRCPVRQRAFRLLPRVLTTSGREIKADPSVGSVFHLPS